MRAPAHCSVEQAIRFAQVLALRGDVRLVEALLGSRLGNAFENEEFWATVIRFFIEHPALDRSHVGPIIDYLNDQRFTPRVDFVAPGVRERAGPPQPNLTIRGRTPQSLLRQVERWHRELGKRRSGKSGSAWKSSGP